MLQWRKKITPEGPNIFEYGDGNGVLLYRLYCITGECDLRNMEPHTIFYGDSKSPNPSIEDVQSLIDREQMNCDAVLCAVTDVGDDADGEVNSGCHWRIL